MQMDEGYMNYVRFLAAPKNRLIEWKEKEKFRTASAPYLIQKLKEVKKVRSKYDREKIVYNTNKETRVLLRVLTREVKIEIGKSKTNIVQEFLSKIQETHDNMQRAFRLYLSHVY